MNYHNTFTPVVSLVKSSIEPGGLCWIKFVKHEDVFSWPEIDPVTGICKNELQLKAGKAWLEVRMPDADKIFTETQEEAAAGSYFKMSVSGYVPGNQAANLLSVGSMAYHQFVVLFRDRDGLTRLIGDPDSGADFKSVYNSGEKSTSRKRNISFNWESVNPAVIYSGSIDEVAPPVVPVLHLVRYGITSILVTPENVASVVLSTSVNVLNNSPSFAVGFGAQNKSVVFSEPATEPVKTHLINGLNNEAIPGYIIQPPVVIGAARYYFTRGFRSFDESYPTILSTI